MPHSYRIFVSSPGDVGREREVAERVIQRVEARFGGRVRLEGYFWEHEPMRVTRGDFQAQIEEPASFDAVVCFLWSRLGSRLHPDLHRRPDGSTYASGTEYEFENAANSYQLSGRPELLVYRRSEMPAFPPEPLEELQQRTEQWQALKEFCERWFRDSTGSFKAAYNAYRDSEEFQLKLEAHLTSLIREWLERDGGLTPTLEPAREARWLHESPYRGLQVFEFQHEPIFFGRTRARDEVLGALQARWTEERCPFVLILGASGSGKSSLLRAGILPWLVRPGLIEGIGLWRRLVWRPSEGGGDLFDGLARALVSPEALPELLADGSSAADLARLLRTAPGNIVGLVKGALSQAAATVQVQEDLARQPMARLALGVDQLEEIFTLTTRFSTDHRTAFLRAIDALVRSGLGWVVMTLRSDFYSRCEELPMLVELKKGRGQYHLLLPNGAEISQMIRYPAEAAGLVFEEHPEKGKLDDIIRDAALAQAGALPLLEYVLDELYRCGADDGILTHAEYAEVGGVEGALARRAEATFDSLSSAGRHAFSAVAGALVRVNEVAEGLRRPAAMASFEDQPAALELIHTFVAARLFVTDKTVDDEPTVLVAHEALLRSWDRFAGWIRDHREELLTRARIEQGAAAWDAKQRDPAYLLAPGKPLEEAEDILNRARATLSPAAAQYVEQSVLAVHEAAVAKEREKLRQALRQFDRGRALWEDFKTEGVSQPEAWRFARLAEIETLLAEAVAINPELREAENLLAGIRRYFVEGAIRSRDLNLASIYLQRLKGMPLDETEVPALEAELETAWAQVDPGRNRFVRQMRRWALRSCWWPLAWVIGGLVVTSLNPSTRFGIYFLITSALMTISNLSTAVSAALASGGEQRPANLVSKLGITSFALSLLALNPVALWTNFMVLHASHKLQMETLFWVKPVPEPKAFWRKPS